MYQIKRAFINKNEFTGYIHFKWHDSRLTKIPHGQQRNKTLFHNQ